MLLYHFPGFVVRIMTVGVETKIILNQRSIKHEICTSLLAPALRNILPSAHYQVFQSLIPRSSVQPIERYIVCPSPYVSLCPNWQFSQRQDILLSFQYDLSVAKDFVLPELSIPSANGFSNSHHHLSAIDLLFLLVFILFCLKSLVFQKFSLLPNCIPGEKKRPMLMLYIQK